MTEAFLNLPIDRRLEEIAAIVRANQNIILTAAPGAGKTTRVPPRLIEALSGQVIVLQPRRMAAVAACHRVCEERGWVVGREAGYRVRFDAKAGPSTRLIFMTDAMLLRQISADPDLTGVDLVILDEFHERNLNQDLALAYVREQQMLGRDIKLMIMSATLSLGKMRALLGETAVIDVEGMSFPLTVEHQTEPLSLKTGPEFVDRVVRATGEAFRRSTGDVLVFLPGVGEINRVRDRIGAGVGAAAHILHGSLTLREQQAVLRPASGRRVILATNVAEASVTVPGVDAVVDSGIARVMQCNLKTGFSQLDLQRISLFNAAQRAGRAARQRPGLCIKLWTSFEEQTQALEPIPECHRVDLSTALLWLAELGITRFEQFSWLERPPGPLLDFARKSLRWLEAIDGENRITALGRKLARFPLPPRWGALLALGEERGLCLANAVALVNERDVLGPEGGRQPMPAFLGACDLWHRMGEIEDGRGWSVETVRQSAEQLRGLLGSRGRDPSREELQELLLLTQGDRLCRRREGGNSALMVGGRGVRLAPGSRAAGSEFFVALQGVDLQGQADTVVSLASGFDKAFLLKHLGARLRTEEDLYFDEKKERFFMRRSRFVFDLPIDTPTLTPAMPETVTERLAEELFARMESLTERHSALGAFFSRWDFLCRYESVHAATLGPQEIRQALALAAFGAVSFAEVLEKDLVGFFRTAIGREAATTLDREVPESFLAPSGVSHRIDYSEGHSAFVEVRLQEIFGLAQSPRLLHGKIPITFRLLGPNFRPVQVTSDLAGFWRTGYHEVRKELRARYPKHSWPEDGLTAKPEAKGRRRQT